VKPTDDGKGGQHGDSAPGEQKPAAQEKAGSEKGVDKPAGQEQGNANERADKGKGKEPGAKSSTGGEQGPDKKADEKQPGSKSGQGDKTQAKPDPDKSSGGGSAEQQLKKEVEALSKALQSKDAKTREEAAQRLKDLLNKSNDPAAREAAQQALKQAGEPSGTKPGEQQQPKTGDTLSNQGNNKPGGQAGSDKGEQKPGQTGDARSNDGTGEQGSGDKNSDKNGGKKPSDQSSANKTGGSGGSGQRGGNEPSNQPPMPNNAGPDLGRPEAEEKSIPDQRYLQRPGELQLEDIKKKVNKDVLNRLKWTEEDYQQFLKAYEEMLKRQVPAAAEKEDPAHPFRGNRSSQNQGVRRVESGVQTKVGNLERIGPTQAPPEFREAYREFSRRLSELERSREQK
jgi:hypothetical protein